MGGIPTTAAAVGGIPTRDSSLSHASSFIRLISSLSPPLSLLVSRATPSTPPTRAACPPMSSTPARRTISISAFAAMLRTEGNEEEVEDRGGRLMLSGIHLHKTVRQSAPRGSHH